MDDSKDVKRKLPEPMCSLNNLRGDLKKSLKGLALQDTVKIVVTGRVNEVSENNWDEDKNIRVNIIIESIMLKNDSDRIKKIEAAKNVQELDSMAQDEEE